MTEKELHEKMNQECLKEVRESGWWIFNKKSITFEKTERMDESNIQTIRHLPDKVCFPKKSDNVVVNDKGIKNFDKFYSWSEIAATGVKKEAIPMEYMDNYKRSLLIGMADGKIIEIEIRDNIDFSNQIGHLIELYKLNFNL